MCTDKNIKEFLPAYLEHSLEHDEHLRVENHLHSCKDCRAEVSLLRMMNEETVPDPGEAFWNEMPNRIYQAVQREKTTKKRFDLSWLTNSMVMPRWAFAATSACIVLVLSVLTTQFIRTSQQERNMWASQQYLFTEGTMADDSLNIAEITTDQADAVNTWANSELASIGEEVAPIIANNTDTDISDEIADLNINEAERFSDILSQWKQEG